jgi:tRNA(fMet)-specific endonuclease VapC
MRYMLDTNICIYAIKKQSPKVFDALRRNEKHGLGISSISVAELWFGVAKTRSSKNAQALTEFLAAFEIASFDEHAARTYGNVRAKLELEGQMIGPLDTQIASHALSLGVTLVSNNLKEFKRVEGLQFENWS